MKEALKGRLRALWQAALGLLFPEQVACLCCGRALDGREADGLCPDCVRALERLEAQQQSRSRTEPLPEGLDYAFAAYPYTAQARTLILQLKFGHVRAAAVPLARALATLPGGEAELMVPVPTTRRRLRQRGFNQAALLCRHAAQELGMPMAELLVRTDDRGAQTTLSGSARRRNVAGCMRALGNVQGKRIVLVDDVYTTGATAAEAARALRAAGAQSVGLFTAAQSTFDTIF